MQNNEVWLVEHRDIQEGYVISSVFFAASTKKKAIEYIKKHTKEKDDYFWCIYRTVIDRVGYNDPIITCDFSIYNKNCNRCTRNIPMKRSRWKSSK